MRNLKGRAKLRGKPLDKNCYIAKISKHEYGLEDDRKFCYDNNHPVEKVEE